MRGPSQLLQRSSYLHRSNLPGRGQTVYDLRGVYMNSPPQEGAHCYVPLELEDGLPDYFTDLLASAGDPAVDVS